MGLTISTDILDIIGIVYSAIGITLSVVQCFFFKIHSRTLDYLQWAYLMAVAQAVLLTPFADQLEVASGQIQLSSDAITSFYAPMGSYVSLQSFALSFLVILVGFLVLMRFITIPEKVQEKGIIYSRVYRLFKGLIKWFYLPLAFQSIYFLLMQVSSELIPSIVILAVLLVFPVVQLLLYRKFDPETENPFIKWLQFANYCKAALFALLVCLAIKFQYTTYYHYVDVILIAYAGFFIVQYNFKYERVGRVFYALGQIIFYFLFSLYAASSPWLNDYYIDLFGLGIIMLLDVIYSIMEVVVVCKEWRNGASSEIVPEDSKDIKEKDKKNSYDVADMEDVSRDQLNDSHVSGQLKKKTNSNKKLGK